jgi:hypothetical protein
VNSYSWVKNFSEPEAGLDAAPKVDERRCIKENDDTECRIYSQILVR